MYFGKKEINGEIIIKGLIFKNRVKTCRCEMDIISSKIFIHINTSKDIYMSDKRVERKRIAYKVHFLTLVFVDFYFIFYIINTVLAVFKIQIFSFSDVEMYGEKLNLDYLEPPINDSGQWRAFKMYGYYM